MMIILSLILTGLSFLGVFASTYWVDEVFNPSSGYQAGIRDVLKQLVSGDKLTVPELSVRTNLVLGKVERILKDLEKRDYVVGELDVKRGVVLYKAR